MDPNLKAIIDLDERFHKVGILGAPALREIVRLCPPGSVQHSVETGAGQSTVLISNISEDHIAFALGEEHGDGSVAAARQSPHLRQQAVQFVTGPSQITLPAHRFEHPLQLALIDGPHGFPFPMLEYYHVYPHLAEGALLIVDDTHIPSVSLLIDHLRADAMFEHVTSVATTAFFRRTGAATTDPLGDDWWRQGLNRARYPDLRHFAPQTARQHAKLWLRRLLGTRLTQRLLNTGSLPD